MATVAIPQPAGRSNDWSRKYPPLVVLLVAAVLIVAALPSALNLPQTNPSTTLEYAPVPPTDEDVPPVAGNFNQFGLGSTAGLEQGGAGGGTGAGGAQTPDDPGSPPPPPGGPLAKGKTPSTKRCVGNPPRQTEDPLSPPCVPDFNCADNGGATYQGVTEEEIKLLFYFDSNISDTGTSRGDESRPPNTYVDLWEQAKPDEHVYARLLRGWQAYFYDRFQTYCRKPHFYVYYGSPNTAGPENKRADAADNYQTIKPFAVISDSLASNDAYLEAMAKRGVLNLGSFLGRSTDFFNEFPKLIWGYSPPVELQAQMFTDYACKNLKDYPVSFSGSFNGRPRKFGLVYTTDPKQGSYRELKNLVKEGLAACNLKVADEVTFPIGCYAANNGDDAGGAAATYPDQGIARFEEQQITTILWPGCIESKLSASADKAGYYPEWVTLGDGSMDGFVATTFQNQNAWRYAMTISNATRVGDLEAEACYLAYKDADPQAPNRDVRGRACRLYNNLRQLFIGIQVAGPRLGPTSIDRGFHAIPKIASTEPSVPACFYNTDDYTCVKDFQVMHWDPDAVPPNATNPGCFRMAEEGKRYIVGTYPSQQASANWKPTDTCNGYGGQALTFLAARP